MYISSIQRKGKHTRLLVQYRTDGPHVERTLGFAFLRRYSGDRQTKQPDPKTYFYYFIHWPKT